MKLVAKIKALFKQKPQVVEEKPPEATEEKVVVKAKRNFIRIGERKKRGKNGRRK